MDFCLISEGLWIPMEDNTSFLQQLFLFLEWGRSAPPPDAKLYLICDAVSHRWLCLQRKNSQNCAYSAWHFHNFQISQRIQNKVIYCSPMKYKEYNIISLIGHIGFNNCYTSPNAWRVIIFMEIVREILLDFSWVTFNLI